MNDNFRTTITAIIDRMPVWIRHDLMSKNASIRKRAEETLAAMIANALRDETRDGA
jgi:hypothetical protein